MFPFVCGKWEHHRFYVICYERAVMLMNTQKMNQFLESHRNQSSFIGSSSFYNDIWWFPASNYVAKEIVRPKILYVENWKNRGISKTSIFTINNKLRVLYDKTSLQIVSTAWRIHGRNWLTSWGVGAKSFTQIPQRVEWFPLKISRAHGLWAEDLRKLYFDLPIWIKKTPTTAIQFSWKATN